METFSGWLLQNVRELLIAFAVALASLVVLLWLRRTAGRWVSQVSALDPTSETAYLLEAVRVPSLVWAALLSAYLAILVSPAPEPWRSNAARIALSLFILATGVFAVTFSRRLVRMLGRRFRIGRRSVEASGALVAVGLILVSVLGILEVWGAPTGPLLVLVGIVGVALVVAARDVLPDVVAAVQVAARQDLQTGDYIRLGTGEEGTVQDLTWRELTLQGVNGARVSVPNARINRTTVTNYGRHFKKAREPFRFYARSYLRELTGLQCRNISELANALRRAPEASIYYHTHLYLEEHQYLIPTPTNAFAEWISDALGNRALGERLATVDVIAMASMEEVRERFLGILGEAAEPGLDGRNALAGSEFYFIQATAFITPCGYEADDLRRLAAVLRRVPLSSLYFHMFESRLLSGGKTANDISRWLRESLDEPDLAREIDRFNPYDYTLEGLRSSLIRLVEARLT